MPPRIRSVPAASPACKRWPFTAFVIGIFAQPKHQSKPIVRGQKRGAGRMWNSLMELSHIRNRSQADLRGARSTVIPIHSPDGLDKKDDDADKKPMTPRIPLLQKRWKCLGILFGIVFALFVFDWLVIGSSLPDDMQLQPEQIAPYDFFTVAINTYKRHDMLEEALDHFLGCPYAAHIHVVWSEPSPVPAEMRKKYDKTRVHFDIHTEDSLNNRFKPLPPPYTNGVLSVDDDMRIPCQELRLAHEVWRGSSRSLVGFMPRLHIRGLKGWIYRCWWRVWWHGSYSIILTKAAFLHHDYFRMYTHTMPQQIRSYIDEARNCEDVAMQFLVANHSSLPPVYVKGHLKDLGVLNGISTSHNVAKAGHMDERSGCLNDLTKMFGRMPLVESHHIVYPASNGWVNRPSTWFEYISSDLWNIDPTVNAASATVVPVSSLVYLLCACVTAALAWTGLM